MEQMQGACFPFALPDSISLAANQWRPARRARCRRLHALLRSLVSRASSGLEMGANAGILLPRSRGMGRLTQQSRPWWIYDTEVFERGGGAGGMLLAPVAASAQSKVVATVNGYEITASEVQLAADDILPQFGEVPANLRFPFVVEYLMERHLLAQAAVKEGITESEEYKRRLAFYQAKALRDAYFAAKLKPSVTEEAVKKSYDEQAAKVETEERARARHILVASEQEAKELSARLTKGEDFETLANEYSLDGSKELAAISAISPLRRWCPFSHSGVLARGRRRVAAGADRVRLASDQARGSPRRRRPAVRERQGDDPTGAVAPGRAGSAGRVAPDCHHRGARS
jgi:hypothetical protein